MTLCTCGTCEECQLRAFMLTQGPKRGWKRLPYSACSAVAEGEQYWQVFAGTHTVGDLRLVKEALLQAGQEEMEPPELHAIGNTPEPSEDSFFRAANLWGGSPHSVVWMRQDARKWGGWSSLQRRTPDGNSTDMW